MRKQFAVTLTVGEDSDFGGFGLCIPGMKFDGVNPCHDGLALAHDLLEHQNGAREIGGIDDELEALGAIWFVRGQFYDLRRDDIGSHYTVHQNIARDITRMFRDFFFFYGAYVAIDAKIPKSRALPEADADLRDIVREARKIARQELDSDTPEHEQAASLREYMRVCLPRMRAGYRKARRQFGDGRTANRLFWNIAEAVDRAINLYGLEGAGQEFELSYWFDKSTGECGATCEAAADPYLDGE